MHFIAVGEDPSPNLFPILTRVTVVEHHDVPAVSNVPTVELDVGIRNVNKAQRIIKSMSLWVIRFFWIEVSEDFDLILPFISRPFVVRLILRLPG